MATTAQDSLGKLDKLAIRQFGEQAGLRAVRRTRICTKVLVALYVVILVATFTGSQKPSSFCHKSLQVKAVLATLDIVDLLMDHYSTTEVPRMLRKVFWFELFSIAFLGGTEDLCEAGCQSQMSMKCFPDVCDDPEYVDENDYCAKGHEPPDEWGTDPAALTIGLPLLFLLSAAGFLATCMGICSCSCYPFNKLSHRSTVRTEEPRQQEVIMTAMPVVSVVP
jgi:hypothetical protein